MFSLVSSRHSSFLLHVMLWAMFCWETLGPAIHVDVTLTHTTCLSIVADHVHPSMETVFPDGCGLFQQDNAPCHKAKMVQEWFDEHNKFKVLTWPPNSPELQSSICGMCWTNKSEPWRPGLKGVESMPRWVRAVLAAKKGPTKCYG
ncbi:hypothetical protein QTP86_034054 [Hemibagrus guttatus]|nr:hypothetical protein QTP86_034054 [Hemibagrus guttatus]